MKVFLGGTVDSSWRDEFILMLKNIGVDYFNPIVENWDDEAHKKEIHERKHCDYVLYVITAKMMGVYSIAEVVDDSNKRPEKTLFCVLEEHEEPIVFLENQLKSLDMVAQIICGNGARVFSSLYEVAEYLKKRKQL